MCNKNTLSIKFDRNRRFYLSIFSSLSESIQLILRRHVVITLHVRTVHGAVRITGTSVTSVTARETVSGTVVSSIVLTVCSTVCVSTRYVTIRHTGAFIASIASRKYLSQSVPSPIVLTMVRAVRVIARDRAIIITATHIAAVRRHERGSWRISFAIVHTIWQTRLLCTDYSTIPRASARVATISGGK